MVRMVMNLIFEPRIYIRCPLKTTCLESQSSGGGKIRFMRSDQRKGKESWVKHQYHTPPDLVQDTRCEITNDRKLC